MSNNKDFKVKNGIQPTVYHEAVGTVVSGQTGVNLAGASYANKSFSVSSQDAGPFEITLNGDGTKLYVLGTDSDDVFQYSMSTAYDISTASYDNVSFSVTGQATSPSGFTLSGSGDRLYVVCNATDNVYQYSLSTAFDLSTASYDSISFSVASQEANPRGITLNSEGTKLYLVGSSSDSVHQYSLSTAYDLSTASYDNVSLSVASQDTQPFSLEFKSGGSKLYVLGFTTDTVYQYSLSTAFDLSTASYDSVSFSVASQDTNPRGFSFSGNGAIMYYLGAAAPATIYQYSTALTTAELDLSTGSVFDYTPTSDVQVTLTNPAASGTSSGATLLLGSEDAAGVSSTFSTTIYDGTGTSPNKITNNIDLAGDGGLVWIKTRGTTADHCLGDTENGAGYYLQSNNTEGHGSQDFGNIVSFNSDGFTVGNYTRVNVVGPLVSWTFKKQTKFFDIVTYTGDGVAGRTISHNLGTTVGTIIVKRTDTTREWGIYHRSLGGTDYLVFDTDLARSAVGFWNNTNPTSTEFTVGASNTTNASGGTYVAYLFAHDTDASSIIQCGSYTGNGSNSGPVVNLGWEPQWLLFKNVSASVRETVPCDWMIFDNVRGIEPTSYKLEPNTTDAEQGQGIGLNVTPTGFQIDDFNRVLNFSGDTFIYMAIRNPFVPTITYDPDLQWSGGTAPTAPATGETDVITFNTTDGGTTYKSALAIDGAK